MVTNADGSIKKCFDNYCEVLLRDPYLQGKIYYNLFDGRVYVQDFFWDARRHPLREEDIIEIRRYVSGLYGLGNKNDIMDALKLAGRRNSYHPIVKILEGIKWDGVERLKELFPRYLGAERSEYTTGVTTLLFHGAIKRVLEPGTKFDSCIILADSMQGSGKSTMCRCLALSDEWFTDELGDLSRNNEAFEAIRGRWIVELGEMIATRKTKDIESIKAYLSRTADVYREPWAPCAEQYLRQAVFIGTTNKPQFLPADKTGNRRFVPLLCDGTRAERHPLEDEAETREYIRQCYAEAMVIGQRDGWVLKLPKQLDDELRALQEESTPDDPNVGMIQAYLDRLPKEIEFVCSKMIWDGVFDTGGGRNPAKYELEDISDIMRLKVTGWKQYRGKDGKGKDTKHRFQKYGPQRAWVRDCTQGCTQGDENLYPDEWEKAEKSPFEQ